MQTPPLLPLPTIQETSSGTQGNETVSTAGTQRSPPPSLPPSFSSFNKGKTSTETLCSVQASSTEQEWERHGTITGGQESNHRRSSPQMPARTFAAEAMCSKASSLAVQMTMTHPQRQRSRPHPHLQLVWIHYVKTTAWFPVVSHRIASTHHHRHDTKHETTERSGMGTTTRPINAVATIPMRYSILTTCCVSERQETVSVVCTRKGCGGPSTSASPSASTLSRVLPLQRTKKSQWILLVQVFNAQPTPLHRPNHTSQYIPRPRQQLPTMIPTAPCRLSRRLLLVKILIVQQPLMTIPVVIILIDRMMECPWMLMRMAMCGTQLSWRMTLTTRASAELPTRTRKWQAFVDGECRN